MLRMRILRAGRGSVLLALPLLLVQLRCGDGRSPTGPLWGAPRECAVRVVLGEVAPSVGAPPVELHLVTVEASSSPGIRLASQRIPRADAAVALP